MLTKSKQPTRIDFQHLVSLYSLVSDNKDERNADKLLDIYKKLNKDELIISFAGHFSAGKSSIINGLLEKSILPKSPIPTSANVVKIQSGNGTARVYFHDGDIVEYEEPYDIDKIKEYAKDKASIKAIEINTGENVLPEGCVVIDTPGIDAADDADRIITESSLHLVDVLFYVMDYNHVQSEVNLQFLKKAEELGIPFFIIINQIDKHNEQEITFRNFEKNIKQTFDQWNIMPQEIYYSSMTKADTAHNEFPVLKKKLLNLMTAERNDYLNVGRSVMQIVNEHKSFLEQRYEEETALLSAGKDGDDPAEQLEALIREMGQIRSKPEAFQNDFKNNLNTTLQNAYLMPADLREKAEEFLVSQQKDFKVGLFGSKRKTEEKRLSRLQNFLQELKKNMESAIEWKLRDKFINLAGEHGITNQEIMERIQNMTITYDEDDLMSAMKPGAKVTGDYVLNYTEEISYQIKQKYKKEAFKIQEMMEEDVRNQWKQKLTELELKEKELSNAAQDAWKMEELQQKLHEQQENIKAVMKNPEPEEKQWEQINTVLDERQRPVSKASAEYAATSKEVKKPAEERRPEVEQTAFSIDRVLDDTNTVIRLIESLPGFQSITDDLHRKTTRLENRSYTIALFGAFSAGKSSFANALIGENILPASPNPTTAVINRINPVKEGLKHGTVIIQHKDEATLVNDIHTLTKNFSPRSNQLSELLDWIRKNKINESNKLNSTHRAYLNAVLAGYQDNKHNLAIQSTVMLNDFAAHVTDETKACYIESVDLYYDCPVTRAGITLVDTPGADSVNARHTNVSFDYIKHADAILYVTYYNHALSRADKDFLLQLGRVKDAFQLDKMFFIMNAADLAEDEAECHMVLDYIKEQLTLLGIRFPRLFPVSSKQSLLEKLDSQPLNNQMAEFEKSLYHFIDFELTTISVQSVYRDIYRALKSVEKHINSLKLNASEKEQFKKELDEKQATLKQLADEIDSQVYGRRISQKVEKQLFYVLERLAIRFHDMFKETFNPTTVTESGKRAQQQLEINLRNLLDYAGYELLQELRAVSLRIESFIQELTKTVYQDYMKKSTQVDEDFMLSDVETPKLETPEYDQALTDLDIKNFHPELKKFNGTKAFFVRNEKEKMKEEIFDRLQPFAKAYLEKHHKTMEDSYISQWDVIIENMNKEIHNSIEQYVKSFSAMFTDQAADMETLSNIHRKLEHIAKSHADIKE
ncbi:dynamin family protein [Virgibacillus kekensis]|uniref:Dynamin family protein n=1 Tax=Virgibacillus kekensis TaxID=202261 RepID=A0ABV9DFU2_9BACI